MDELTLDATWKRCMSMWRWIAKMKRAGDKRSVEKLKRVWAEKHGWQDYSDRFCAFCDYLNDHEGMCETGCPGTLVDPSFNCHNKSYRYDVKPIEFYNKLRSMYRIYLKETK